MLLATSHTKLTIQQPIKMSYRFLQALFATEQQYEARTKYRIRNNGAARLAHHLTKADLQLALTLQKIVDVQGQISYTNRHLIYQQLVFLWERAISKDQFYAAFEKFIFNGLLVVSKDSPDTIKVQLASYLEPSGELGRFVLLPELIMSRAFAELPLTHQKLYLYACGQQGDQRGKELQLNLDNGLYDMLHRQETGLIRTVLQELSTTPLEDGQPLFSVGRIERNKYGRPKAVFQVNAKLLPVYVAGQHYRVSVPMKKGIGRLIRRFEGYFNAAGCEDLSWYNREFLGDLAALLRGKSEAYIHYVMQRVTQLGQSAMMKPVDLLNTIKAELCSRAAGIRLAIAERTGILGYLERGAQSRFGEAFRNMPLRTFRTLCKRLLPELTLLYSRSAAFGPNSYRKPGLATEELEAMMDLSTFRFIAFQRKRDPEAFIQLVQDCYWLWHSKRLPQSELNTWLATKLDDLPCWRPVPDPPADFDLISYMQTACKTSPF
ncbi:hypothetical protein PAT3040_03988 [Paenibacillus agaridevorans]|uniref:Uncharacterized protein n=1 Tax=Paenibacillus agaridevorans TaxID=171404 RepID=A0A2R5F104_9BACL|nr:hypothetical protein [Paenibacillus agaridevorans]GBG09344.1 hypothetical protein PAT3040_03988 [Paenibacillus agaridevorans]